MFLHFSDIMLIFVIHRLDEHKLESRSLGEISITSDMQMTPPYGRKQTGTKEPLDEGERGE